ncbi:MAG TPA: GAF domain-containing protein [Bacteroidota bacterium]
MERYVSVTRTGKAEVYEEIIPQLESLLEGESDPTANLANTTAVLKMAFPARVSWVGFYLLKGGELVLGPFQGKPACVRIGMGKGVCGTAAKRRETIIVPDVDQFPGHIACDPDSRSEIVVPLIWDDELVGVLDLDSPQTATFDETDRRYLERIRTIILRALGSYKH